MCDADGEQPLLEEVTLLDAMQCSLLRCTFSLPSTHKLAQPCTVLRQPQVGEKLILKFRKYFRDPSKRMHQGHLRETLEQHRHRPSLGGRTAGNPDDDTPLPPRPPPPAATTSGSGDEAAAQESSEDLAPFREGVVDSVKENAVDAEVDVAFVSGLFSQEEDIRAIAKLGLAVRTEEGLTGHLKGPFGKLGKCKVEFARGGNRPLQAGQRVFVPR